MPSQTLRKRLTLCLRCWCRIRTRGHTRRTKLNEIAVIRVPAHWPNIGRKLCSIHPRLNSVPKGPRVHGNLVLHLLFDRFGRFFDRRTSPALHILRQFPEAFTKVVQSVNVHGHSALVHNSAHGVSPSVSVFTDPSACWTRSTSARRYTPGEDGPTVATTRCTTSPLRNSSPRCTSTECRKYARPSRRAPACMATTRSSADGCAIRIGTSSCTRTHSVNHPPEPSGVRSSRHTS